jgi:hypothetical protein
MTWRTTDGRRTPSEGELKTYILLHIHIINKVKIRSGELKTYILLHIHVINKVKIKLNIIVTCLRALNCGFYYTRAALPFMKKSIIRTFNDICYLKSRPR